MKHRKALILVMFATIALASTGLPSCSLRGGKTKPAYPPAEASGAVDLLHGQAVSDSFRWLEDSNSIETTRWVRRENSLTKRTLAPLEQARLSIAKELECVYSVDSISAVHPHSNRYFTTRHRGLSNHNQVYMAKEDPTGIASLVLDPNAFSTNGAASLDWWYPSPDGSLIAYGRSNNGSELSTLYVRNVVTGEDLPDVIPFTQYCRVAWNPNGTGFYYNRSPDPATVPSGEGNFHMRVYYHALGSPWQQDRNIWGEGRPIDEEPRPYATSDGKHVLLNFYRDPARNDLFLKSMNPEEPFVPVIDGEQAITTGDVFNGTLYLRTNRDAPRFRICTATVDQPGPKSWHELIGQQKGVISDFLVVGGRIVLHIVEDVHSRLLLYDLQGNFLSEVQLPGLGMVADLAGGPESSDLFFSYSSWIQPPVSFRYSLQSGELDELWKTDCPVDLSDFVTKQIWYSSADGTRVPMFVIARRGVPLDGTNPTLLYGYGGFNVSLFPSYRPRIIPFLLRGGVWALANIRGGGEMGQLWHEAGRRENKQRSFEDFYAAAEALIALGYTKPRYLACKGGSNGGLLIGAAITQRPDLFQAALSQVPLMDMLRFNLFGMGAQWVHEYGDPNKREEFAWLRAYSPYHNVVDGTDYPAVLLVTAEADNRVHPCHALKMAARLQQATSGCRPILIRVEGKAGHGAGKPLNMKIHNQSEDWVFLMWQLGMLNGETNGDDCSSWSRSREQ